MIGVRRETRSVPTSPDLPAITTPEGWEAAVGVTDGPQLVLAGPGTGKTQFLAERVARLIAGGTTPGSILVLTFSRRAASELERRITGLLDRPAGGATASTFHSYAHRLIELHMATEGRPMPVLLTGPEQVRLVHELLAAEDPADWPVSFRPILTSDTFASEVADFVMRCHERLLDPDGLSALAERRADWRGLPPFLRRYGAALARRGRIDYARLLAEAVAVSSQPNAPGYDYVVVDEFQDTSPAEARLAEQSAADGNITVAADPHQSIYSFRGAEIDNVAEFPQRIRRRHDRDTITIVLARSFRVPTQILAAANRLVAADPIPGPVRFTIEPADHDGRVDVHTFDQRSAEAEWIAGEIERMHVAERLPLGSMAVVVRSTRHLLPELSRALDRRRLSHDRPDTRLVDHPAVRIVHDIAIAASAPPNAPESELAIRRVLLGPLVTLSLGRERELLRLHHALGVPWPQLIRAEIPHASGLADLVADGEWTRSMPAVDGFWHLWDRLPGVERIVMDPDRADFRAAWSTFARMLERLAERDPSVTLLESLATSLTGDFEANPLLSFTRPEGDRLAVTTLHQAKGLEFEVVFIADAVEGVFPDTGRSRSLLRPELLAPSRTTDTAAQVGFRLAEERRLAYTASTRARRRVVWTATTAGIDEGERRPSRFLLAAAGVDSFEAIGPPPRPSDNGRFSPLTLSDAEARLRRFVADPEVGPVTRLASLRVLTDSPAHWAPSFFAGVPEPGPDTGLVEGAVRLSPSQATNYDECPRRYAIERRLRAIEGDSPYALFGSIIHEVLELAEGDALAAGLSHADVATATRHLDVVWPLHADFGSPALNDVWHRRGVQLLEEMYGDWPGGDRPPIGLELEMSSTIDGVEWVGRADRVDRGDGGGFTIVDYKTSKNPPTLKDAARSLQLGYYLLAAAEHPALMAAGPATGAELWFPMANGRTVYPFAMEHLPEVRGKLVDIAAGIVGEDWSPRVGRHCDRCPVKNTCPAWPDGREAYR